jgi:hypothetical protein
MSRFNELSLNLNSVLLKLIENKNLCKLLYYNTNDPLSEIDIIDNTSLLFNKIYPYPFTPDINNNAESIINVFFDDFEIGKDNNYFKNASLTFIVICNTDLWRIQGDLRPFAILNEIDMLFNQQLGFGIGKTNFDRGTLLWLNEKYSGYKITYNICDFN